MNNFSLFQSPRMPTIAKWRTEYRASFRSMKHLGTNSHKTPLARLRQTNHTPWKPSCKAETDQPQPMNPISHCYDRPIKTHGNRLARLQQTNHNPWKPSCTSATDQHTP